jgi:hypothetical protein
MLFALYDLPEIIWNLMMIYGVYVIYTRASNALKSDAGKKAAVKTGFNIVRWLFK